MVRVFLINWYESKEPVKDLTIKLAYIVPGYWKVSRAVGRLYFQIYNV